MNSLFYKSLLLGWGVKMGDKYWSILEISRHWWYWWSKMCLVLYRCMTRILTDRLTTCTHLPTKFPPTLSVVSIPVNRSRVKGQSSKSWSQSSFSKFRGQYYKCSWFILTTKLKFKIKLQDRLCSLDNPGRMYPWSLNRFLIFFTLNFDYTSNFSSCCYNNIFISHHFNGNKHAYITPWTEDLIWCHFNVNIEHLWG